jgi:hydrogenase-4 component B
LLALTSALAAACFVKVFGISFLALPRSSAAADAHEAPRSMLVPQASLAVLCFGLGLFPGVVLSALSSVLASLPGLQPAASILWGPGDDRLSGRLITVPVMLGVAFVVL